MNSQRYDDLETDDCIRCYTGRNVERMRRRAPRGEDYHERIEHMRRRVPSYRETTSARRAARRAEVV